MSTKEHWEHIYSTKTPQEVSWTQTVPQTSLDLIAKYELPKFAKIIDIGGGDSLLVDHLLALGYSNITLLDISSHALERAKIRLGENADKVEWIVADIRNFTPTETYDLWHDRAAFHFLTDAKEIENYRNTVSQNTHHLILSTFAADGPLKCSGLHITQYDATTISTLFGTDFQVLESFQEDHRTPFDTIQSFCFSRMSRK